ncbi:S1C family serine protease [Oenococcus alcoholitolerans]|uniref:S1C family serine protease n=1 Tax=Oenococcus alcoholitolerans TaxID=931074 RepID=UPI003F714E46
MPEIQEPENNQTPDDKNKKNTNFTDEPEVKNHNFGRIVATIFASAVLGGGVAAGAGYIYTQTTNFIGRSTGVSGNGKTTVQAPIVTGNSNATKVYNGLKQAVVSVVNQQQAGNGSPLNGSNSGNNFQTQSEGSGVIYRTSPTAAYIVTNHHVVAGADRLRVVLYNNRQVTAHLVGSDAMTDLAVLRIPGSGINSSAQFGNSNQIATGQPVLAIGSPLGTDYASSVTAGIISSPRRLVSNLSSNGRTNYGDSVAIQTDAAINPGNSGGPLVNMAGQVIGINSQKLTQTTSGVAVEGMGFAIPSNTTVDIINKLIKNGRIVRPALGVEVVDLSEVSNEERDSNLKLPNSVNNGVVIAGFSSSDSPARKAGLKKYDVLVAVNGKKIDNLADMRDIIYKLSVGDSIKATFYRGSVRHTRTIKMTEILHQ